MTPSSRTLSPPDARRFAALFDAEYPRIVAFLRRRVGEVPAAEDLASETFHVALRRELDGQRVAAPWLFVTARNLLANHLRRTATREHLTGAPDAMPQAAVQHEDDVADDVRTVLAGLRPDHQAVLRLRYWDELSARESAAVLGCSEAAVWVRLHRARASFDAEWRRRPDQAAGAAAPDRLVRRTEEG